MVHSNHQKLLGHPAIHTPGKSVLSGTKPQGERRLRLVFIVPRAVLMSIERCRKSAIREHFIPGVTPDATARANFTPE
jgi:hypothetical protein